MGSLKGLLALMLDILSASVAFIVVMLAVVGLDLAREWASQQGIDTWMIDVLLAVEYYLFFASVIGCVWFTAKSLYKFVTEA